MNLLLASISPRRPAGPAAAMLQTYLERSNRFAPTAHRIFASETKLFAFLEESAGRTRPALLLADSRGKQWNSEDFAAAIGGFLDNGTQQLIVAIGPADGWSPEALQRANLTVAFGRITLPHELAAVIAAEQIYRALTIRAGHPYHTGH